MTEYNSEKLIDEIKRLKFYLAKAVEDIHICAQDQKGFLKVCEPIKVTLFYESDLANMLEPQELKFVREHNLPTKVTTPPYSFGTWKWRYEKEVKKLLEEGITID